MPLSPDDKRTYTCEGCGATLEATPSEAFHEGWDTPEMFMSHCTCSKCPITTTLWWRIMVEGHRDLTVEEQALLIGYNEAHAAHNEGGSSAPTS